MLKIEKSLMIHNLNFINVHLHRCQCHIMVRTQYNIAYSKLHNYFKIIHKSFLMLLLNLKSLELLYVKVPYHFTHAIIINISKIFGKPREIKDCRTIPLLADHSIYRCMGFHLELVQRT